MNRQLITVLTGILLQMSCLASLQIDIPLPGDDAPTKFALWTDPAMTADVEADRKRLQDLEEQLRTLPESRLLSLFGSPQAALPAGYALPVHHHDGVGFSGLGYNGGGKSYFLPLGDVGGVLVFPYGGRDFVSAVAIYLKTNAGFVPLRSRSDYPARRAWELRQTDALAKHLQAVLK